MAVTGIKIAHIIVLVLYSASAIVFSIISFSKINNTSEEALDIIDNWRAGAIQEIKVEEKCPEGYEEAFNVTWPGTEAGCYCQNITDYSKSTFKVDNKNSNRACKPAELSAGCLDVHNSPKTLLDNWGLVGDKPVKVCFLRSNDTWARVGPKSGEDCQDPNTIKCGSTPQNTFCSSESVCPINDIKIMSLDLKSNPAALVSCIYASGCLVLSRNGTDARVLRFKRADTGDALPISEMRLNEFSMCKRTDKDNITPNRTQFWLLEKTRSTCANEGTALWNTLDTRTEEQVFALNGLSPTIEYLNQFGYYANGAKGSSYQWGIFARNYIRWNITCRGQMDTLAKRYFEIRTLKIAQIVELVVSGIVNTILGLLVPCFLLADKFPKFTKVFNWVGKLSLLPCQIVCALIAFSIYVFFTDYVLDECSDPPVIQILRNMGMSAQEAYKSNVNGIVASVLAILFDIVNGIYQWTKGKSQEAYHPQVNIEASLRANDHNHRR